MPPIKLLSPGVGRPNTFFLWSMEEKHFNWMLYWTVGDHVGKHSAPSGNGLTLWLWSSCNSIVSTLIFICLHFVKQSRLQQQATWGSKMFQGLVFVFWFLSCFVGVFFFFFLTEPCMQWGRSFAVCQRIQNPLRYCYFWGQKPHMPNVHTSCGTQILLALNSFSFWSCCLSAGVPIHWLNEG